VLKIKDRKSWRQAKKKIVWRGANTDLQQASHEKLGRL
jgi:hypothetical protein